MKSCPKCGAPMAWVGITFEGFECINDCHKVKEKVYSKGNVVYIDLKKGRKCKA